MTTIIDEEPSKFCQNCKRTLMFSRSSLKEAQPFCYHIIQEGRDDIIVDTQEMAECLVRLAPTAKFLRCDKI